MAKKKRDVRWHPSSDDYNQIIDEQNPWRNTGIVPDEWAKKSERPLAKYFWTRVFTDKPKRFQMVLGPRRVGKTTCMYQTVRRAIQEGIDPKKLYWFRLDHPLLMRVNLRSLLKAFVDANKPSKENPLYFFLDELTYAEEWDLWLKTFYDESWPIQIIGSSSSTAALRDRLLESGVGRWEEQYLAPYLFSEYLDLVGDSREVTVMSTLSETIAECAKLENDLTSLSTRRRRFLLTGGFPELLLREQVRDGDEGSILLQSQRILRNDAVERAIYKDIPQAFGVDNPLLLERLLYVLAGQMAGLLSPSSICQSLDSISQPTFDRYLSYLEKAFLVFTLPNYSGNEAAIQRRGRKLYFVDGAVRNAALQRGLLPLNNETEMGSLVENMVAGHLHALCQQSQVRLYHWRDKNDEVDLVYDHPEKPMAFEIATGSAHHRKGLYAFAERYPRFRGRCYLISPHAALQLPTINTVNEVGSIPLDLFLLMVSAQAEKELENNLFATARQA